MKKLTVPAETERLDEVVDFVNSFLEENDCSMKTQMQIAIAVEEIYVNIAHYAYPDKNGEAEITCEMSDRTAEITFSDNGIPYNPLEKPDPDITLDANERNIGGLGIFMVKKSMDNIEYQRKDEKNILKIYKAI